MHTLFCSEEDVSSDTTDAKFLKIETQHDLDIFTEYLTQSIPPPPTVELRSEVWDCYNGADHWKSTCYCCDQPLSAGFFQCAHVKARSACGPSILSNLRPVCTECNFWSGRMNLSLYAEWFPEGRMWQEKKESSPSPSTSTSLPRYWRIADTASYQQLCRRIRASRDRVENLPAPPSIKNRQWEVSFGVSPWGHCSCCAMKKKVHYRDLLVNFQKQFVCKACFRKEPFRIRIWSRKDFITIEKEEEEESQEEEGSQSKFDFNQFRFSSSVEYTVATHVPPRRFPSPSSAPPSATV